MFPELYSVGKDNKIFNLCSSLMWILESVVFGVGLTLILLYTMSVRPIGVEGYNSDLWMTSIEIYTMIILLVNIKLSIEVRHWTKILFVSVVVFSLGTFLGYLWVSNYILSQYVEGTVIMCFRNPITYFIVLFVCLVAVVYNSLVVYVLFHSD